MTGPFAISRANSEPILPVFVGTTSPADTCGTQTPTTTQNIEEKSENSPPEPQDIEARPSLQQKSHQPPQNRLARLPTWISFWLGYRKTPPPPEKNHVVWIWSFIGAFSCISIIQGLFGNVPHFVEKGVPSIGATVILLYGAIESPLSQPRPVIGGHLVGALTGVAITKLFLLLPTEQRFEELSWLAGSLCCAVALVFMQMTGTMHPPAGATALLAAVSPDIRVIGWLYVPIVLLAACIALFVALFSNNMQRRYPTFWWTPPPTVAPSFFPTLELSRTLTRTLTWTSNSKTLNSFRGRSRTSKKRGAAKKDSKPTPDQDWHYALKNHSKIFGGKAALSRSGSRSRDTSTSRTRRNPTRLVGVYVRPGTVTPITPSRMTSPQNSTSTPTSPVASAAVSRRPSTEDLHVGFQVQSMHPQYDSPRHRPQTNYLRYLAMKREGTLPGGRASGLVSPVESGAVSRVSSADGLADHRAHAQQLIAALTPAVREREEQEGLWEDEEEDLADAITIQRVRRS